MLSVCIPIYNFDVRQLVYDLHNQAETLKMEYEILLIDDGSTADFREKNKELAVLAHTYYEELDKNIGRSAIRNLLAGKAQYTYLVFMDCDAKISKNDYLEQYAKVCQPNIVCFGGCVYDDVLSDKKFYLRWLFGRSREDIDIEIRYQHPNTSFTTFNFLIDKDVFNRVKFDEHLTSYGHEDTLFGIELANQNIQISHIYNPLIHIGLDDAETFIRKTELSMDNLVRIQQKLGEDGEAFTLSVKSLRVYEKLRQLRLTSLITFFFRYTKKGLLNNLLGSKPKMICLDLYKLGYLCTIKQKEK